MEKIIVDESVQKLCVAGLRKKGMSNADFAREMEKPRSWPTKLFNGTLKTLSKEDYTKIENLFNIKLAKSPATTEAVLPLAEKLNELLTADSSHDQLFETLIDTLSKPKVEHTLPYIPTKKLVELGKKLMRVAHESPDKDGKLGRVAIVELSLILESLSADSESPRESFNDFTATLRGCVAAGSPCYADGFEKEIKVKKQYPADHYALQVIGDSMEPKVKDGSTIMVRPLESNEEISPNRLYVVSSGHGSSLKQIKDKMLVSLNPKHPDIRPLDDAQVQGVYVETV